MTDLAISKHLHRRRSPEQHPLGVIEGSRVDVSSIAALAIDKIAYHLPLCRQH